MRADFSINLESLNTNLCVCIAENYERLEANKKRQVHMKRQCVGSVIRYQSVLMPLVSDVSLKEENVDVEGYFTWFLMSYTLFLCTCSLDLG